MLSTTPWDLTISNIFWRVPAGWTIVNGQGTNYINVRTGSTGGAVEVDFNDACGINIGKYLTVQVGNGGISQKNRNQNVLPKLEESVLVREEVSLFPNPVATTVNIVTNSKDYNKVTIALYSPLGKEILRVKAVADITKINLEALAKGVYFVHIFDGKKTTIKKIVKI